MWQGDGQIVPLGKVAHHRSRVLNAVIPFHAGAALRHVDGVAGDDVDRRAVAKGVVNRHGRVLQPDGAVYGNRRGLAFHLAVTVRHRDGRLLMAAGNELGRVILAIVHDGFMEAPEAGPWVGR